MITAAYTVLSDQDKRAAYDGARLISSGLKRSSRSGGAHSSSSNSSSSADTTGSGPGAWSNAGVWEPQFKPSFRFGGGSGLNGGGGYAGYGNAGFAQYRRSGYEHIFTGSRY
jgi:DnaJ-class molecular chaperone